MTGFPGKPTLDSLEGRVVNDDLRTAGEFTCSNALLNHIYHDIVWGTRGNYRSIPTDCPQRDERQGWLGDRSEESRGETYLFDNSELYAKWLQDMADAQQPDGSVPDVAPAYWPIYSDNVIWPSSSVIIPEMLREQFDDTRIIASHYDSVKLWMELHERLRDERNHFARQLRRLVRAAGGTDADSFQGPGAHHRQDACWPRPIFITTSDSWNNTPRCSAKRMTRARFANRRKKSKPRSTKNSSTANAANTTTARKPPACCRWRSDWCRTTFRARVFDHLVDKIENETHGHIGTGLVGGQYLCRVLTDNGRPDLVYTIASQKDYPELGLHGGEGATTIWELWNGNTADPTMNSGNHVMLIGDLVVWLYEDLAGIKPDPAQPGFKHILMKPTPVGDLNFVKATHNSPYGLISSEWHRDGNKFDWQIEIPANTTATVYVPATSLEAVTVQRRESRCALKMAARFLNSAAANIILSANETNRRKSLASILDCASLCLFATGCATVENQSAIVKSEFIFETAPFPSCHASTIAETKSGLVAAWFGGTAERNPDVCIYVVAARKRPMDRAGGSRGWRRLRHQPVADVEPGFVPAEERAVAVVLQSRPAARRRGGA